MPNKQIFDKLDARELMEMILSTWKQGDSADDIALEALRDKLEALVPKSKGEADVNALNDSN